MFKAPVSDVGCRDSEAVETRSRGCKVEEVGKLEAVSRGCSRA